MKALVIGLALVSLVGWFFIFGTAVSYVIGVLS